MNYVCPLRQRLPTPTAYKFNKKTPTPSASHASDGANTNQKNYWYHSDHISTSLNTSLGSSSYISNHFGKVIQHIEYLPFGETLVDEHLNSYNSPFKFNAKELDPETGNYYYGARYYDPKSSLWLSIDPLAEKYPNFSPYAYTFQNPINFIDPWGMEGEGWGKGADGKWVYDKDVTAENYKEKKYTDYLPDGSILENATINGGKIGRVYLGSDDSNIYYVNDNNFSDWLIKYDLEKIGGVLNYSDYAEGLIGSIQLVSINNLTLKDEIKTFENTFRNYKILGKTSKWIG